MLGRIENSALYPAHIENYAFIDGVTDGKELLEAGISQIKRFGTEVSPEDVLKIFPITNFYSSDVVYSSPSIKQSIITSLIPIFENPPSWNKFCKVTFLVRSEKSVKV